MARWFSVAWVYGDALFGYESGYIHGGRLAVSPGGYYLGESEPGQHLAFVSVALSFFNLGLGKITSVGPGSEGNRTDFRIDVVRG